MKTPLKLKSVKPFMFNELLWMCKYFKIEGIDKNNIITFSGKVTMVGDCRVAYGKIINDKGNRGK